MTYSIIDSQTWFGSSAPLNRTGILQDIRPKTSAEYDILHNENKADVLQRKGKFPAYSEYTDRFGIKTKLEPIMTTYVFSRLKIFISQHLFFLHGRNCFLFFIQFPIIIGLVCHVFYSTVQKMY